MAVLAIAALAQPGVAHAAGPAVTVYTHDLGFVRESRTLDAGADRDTVQVPITERVDFSSVRLVPERGKVVRLAYRYDVPSGDGALDRARGGRVRVALRGDRIVEGTLIVSDGSWLVVREDDGSLHTIARGSVDDARLSPTTQRLTLKPVLEAVVEGAKGKTPVELSYLTSGLSWNAEHTLVRRGETGGTWSSSVTVQNETGVAFVDATLKLVAGEPNREGGGPQPMARGMVMEMAAKSAPDLSEEAFSEYHLYTLGRPATLRDRESQALSMYEPRDIKLKPRYLYRGGDTRGVRSQLEIVNDAASGLGVPLPGGRVRIYENDPSGALQFTGEATIGHTAEGEKLTLEVGSAFDLVAERRELYRKRIADRESEYAVEIKLRNRKKTRVEIVVEESAGGDVEVTQSTQELTRKDANTLTCTVPVDPAKEAVVRYTARVRY